jgi:hypothetical protein
MLSSAARILCVLVAASLLLGAVSAVAKGDNQGFIYGRVTTESGNEYTGFLRWGDEEAFWDDLFHSTKEDLPYYDAVVDEDERIRERHDKEHKFWLQKLLFTVKDNKWGSSRVFISRFGDIERIIPIGDDEAEVEMKSGETYDVEGYANDVSDNIHVSDEAIGEIDLRWERIEAIEFMSAPNDADPGVWRLHGKVETDAGDFEGFIQWDKQECLNSDLLDGDTEDGDISIEMGRIESIKRRGSRSSLVILRDGREMRLRGSNDVNSENRGIMVEDPRFGRVTVSWDAFDRLSFSEPGGSGRGYQEFRDQGPLQGSVTDRDGDTYEGRIVFDLDESEGWEILNGSYRDVEFDIPFNMIASIEPQDPDESVVVLRNGEELELEDSQDVSDDNDGVLVFTEGDRDPVYIEWDDVEMIRFEW